MPNAEEKKPMSEQESSSTAEKPDFSLDNLEFSSEKESAEDAAPEPPSEPALPQEKPHGLDSSPKVELKHAPVMGIPHALVPATAAVPAAPASAHPTKEITPSMGGGIEIEIDIVLDRKRIPLAMLETLAEGEMITLGGADFKATLFVQEKAIAEAKLIMIEQRPAIQVTKILSLS